MSDNEKLIKEAAKAIQDRATWPSLHWPPLHALSHTDVARAIAEAALAVFEKAHTPTDDEREALDYAIRCAIPNDLEYRPLHKLIRAIQDSVLAAGFLRSDQEKQ